MLSKLVQKLYNIVFCNNSIFNKSIKIYLKLIILMYIYCDRLLVLIYFFNILNLKQFNLDFH